MHLSESERGMVKKCLCSGLRLDGRALTQRRKFILEESERLQTNSLYGCRIQNPDNANWIYFSITARVERCFAQAQKGNLLVLRMESPDAFHGGSSQRKGNLDLTAESERTELISLVNSLLLNKLDSEKLSVGNYDCYWALELHVYSLSRLALNDLDYIVFGLTHSLINLRMPKVEVSMNVLNDQFTFEMLPGKDIIFEKSDLPVIFLIGEIQGQMVLDLTLRELQVVDSLFVASFGNQANLLQIEKIDGKSVSIAVINSILMRTKELVLTN